MAMRRTSRFIGFVAAAALASTLMVVGPGGERSDAQTTVLYDEAVSGDISGDRLNPLSLTLSPGSNLLNGSVGGSERDYVTVNVPAGHELHALDLADYQAPDNQRSFIGIQTGTTFTEDAFGADAANLLGFMLFASSDEGSDILPAIGSGMGAQGFTGALAAGDYTFWIQELTPSAVGYSFDLQVRALPVATCFGMDVTIDMNQNGGDGTGTPGNDVILGTPGNDMIDGMGGADIICGEAGNDTINGGDDKDFIFGGEGDDFMVGGEGNDRIRGQQGNDRIDGENGNDFLFGGTGEDTINGGDGKDFLGGFGGIDTINGGNGNDRVFGGFGADIIDGGSGNDEINGLIGNDTINGGDGDDIIRGDQGKDTINGDAGNDDLAGGNAEDTINGGDGDDIVAGGRANDGLSGGEGEDTCAGNRGDDFEDGTCETSFSIEVIIDG